MKVFEIQMIQEIEIKEGPLCQRNTFSLQGPEEFLQAH